MSPEYTAPAESAMFDPARHIPLSVEAWQAEAARQAIREIVDDALDRFDPDGFWPGHPLDRGAVRPSTSLYFGAAGVLWALDHLRRTGAVAFEPGASGSSTRA